MTPENKGVNCENWVKTFSKASNSDPEIEAHGKHFTCSYLLDMEQHQFVVEAVSYTHLTLPTICSV